jgi:DNA-binding MarR family transcriptional regulator
VSTQEPPPRARDLDADGSGLAWALHRLAVSSAVVDTVMAARLGISATDYLAMKHVMTVETLIGPVELSRLLGMTSGSATALVDRLQRSGHLKRTQHPQDRRRLLLAPTEHARSQILTELEPLGEGIAQLSQGFTQSEREAIQRFLTLAADHYSDYRR